MKQQSNKIAYIALGMVCIFWGTTYFGIRVAVKDLPPFFLSGFRHIISGSLLVGYAMLIQKQKLPPKNELKKIFVMGIFLILFSNTMLNWAEIYIPSGLAALLCSFVPFYILFFNLIMRNHEPINFYTGIGLLIGLMGLMLIFYDSFGDITNKNYLPGIIFTVVANCSWALGTIYAKKAKIKVDAFFSSGLQMLMLGVTVTVLSFFCGEFDAIHFTSHSVSAVFYLVIFGSVIGYSSYTYAVTHLPTTVVSIYAYVNPVVAVLLGSIFLEEKITPITLWAMGLTLCGVFMVNFGYQKSNLQKR